VIYPISKTISLAKCYITFVQNPWTIASY